MSKLQANLVLLLAAALWGLGNVAQKTVLEHLDPMSTVGLRCLIGGFLILPFVNRLHSGRASRAYRTSLLRVGGPFALGLVLQQAAFSGTSVTNASFLVNTESVLVPMLAWAMLRERPSRPVLLAATATCAGVTLLSGGLPGGFLWGDLLALAAALAFALWTVELSRHLRRHGDPLFATAAQFLLAALLALPFGAMSGRLSVEAVLAAGPELVLLGVFSTALAFGLQTSALRFTTSSHAAVIVSAESVFGAAGGALFLAERLSPTQALGCVLVLGAILLLARAPLASPAERKAPQQPSPPAASLERQCVATLEQEHRTEQEARPQDAQEPKRCRTAERVRLAVRQRGKGRELGLYRCSPEGV